MGSSTLDILLFVTSNPLPSRSPLRLEQVAKWIEVPISDLKDLNPSLRLDRLPPDCGVNLNLPSGAREKFDSGL